MAASMHPFLMFQGGAEEAMDFYVSLFPSARINSIDHYGEGEPGPAGSVRHATFTLAGQTVRCIDSPAKHDFTFTPSFSFFVECESDDEIDRLAAALSDGGAVLMPLEDYGFSRRFTWLADRFGVSWQLNLA